MICAAFGGGLADQSLDGDDVSVLLAGKAGELNAAEGDLALAEGRLDHLTAVRLRRTSDAAQYGRAKDEPDDRRDLVSNSWHHGRRSFHLMPSLAMGVLVKLYAWTRTVFLAAFSSLTTASVQPPFGEKKTWTGGRVVGWDVSWAWQAGRRQAKSSPRINRFMVPSFSPSCGLSDER